MEEQHAAKRRRAVDPAGDMPVAAEGTAMEGPVPLLVRVLGGNPVTSITILACLDTADARFMRRLHPAVAGVVAAVPWCDMDTPVVDPVRWRAGLPAALGARLASSAEWDRIRSEPVMAALGGITRLDLRNCRFVTNDLLLRLPTSLRALNVCHCKGLTGDASFAHLTALASLECGHTAVVSQRTDGLPPSLLELNIRWVGWLQYGASLAHLSQLRVLRADGTRMGTITLASLPSGLQELYASHCSGLEPETSFAHLTALRKLDVAHSAIYNASLATMPPCLVFLNARMCNNLTPAATLPHLPVLQLLDVSGTAIGDALVASLPASLMELRLAGCYRVSARAKLDHLRVLRQLHCIGTNLAPAARAMCRARVCAVSAVSLLRGHDRLVMALALLGDGRLVTGDLSGEVRLWDVATGGEAKVVLRTNDSVRVLAVLRDGRRVAIGTASCDGKEGYIEVWDVGGVPPALRNTIYCCAGVRAFGVLPDGAVASGSEDKSVRLWDVGAGVCVATLTGHTSEVWLLAVLADGRLASGPRTGDDSPVRLWDVGARACVGVLTGHISGMSAMAALPDGRLATGDADGAIRLWDTRPVAAAGARHAAGATPVEVVGLFGDAVRVVLAMPDGRLACSCGSAIKGALCLLDLPPPAAYE